MSAKPGPPIEPAAPADLPTVLALLREAALPGDDVEAHFGDYLVARGEGVAGAVGLEVRGSQGLLRSLVVRPGARRTGLGRALVAACLDHARSRGVREVYLLAESAAAYFERLGFARVERAAVAGPVLASVEFREACCETAAVMRLDLA